jgi:molybdopterin converting factor small subunit
MKLRVQYMGQLRTAAGRSEEELDLPESTNLAALLSQLASHLGDGAAPHLITPSGHAQGGLLVVVNGSAVAAPHAAATILRTGDVVTLLPPIAGG